MVRRGRPEVRGSTAWAPVPTRRGRRYGPAYRDRPKVDRWCQPRRDPMTPVGDGWWRWDAPGWTTRAANDDGIRAVGGARLRVRARRAAAGPPRPAQRVAAARGARPEPHLRRRAASPGPTTSWRGPRSGAGVLGSVVYELHVGTFTPEGTLDAAVARLDHLVDLGVDVVELMPVAAFPGRWGWGYDGVGALRRARRLRRPGGAPAVRRRLPRPRARAWRSTSCTTTSGRAATTSRGSVPTSPQAHHTPWGPAVNLDHVGAGEVRRFLVESALRWFRDFHVDALRLDAVHELKDDSPHALPRRALRRRRRPVAEARAGPLDLVAESDLNDTVDGDPDAPWAAAA